MKRVAAGLVTAGLFVSGAACGSPESEPQPTTTASVRPTTTETRVSFDDKELIERERASAESMIETNKKELSNDIAKGHGQVNYNQGNCIAFSGEFGQAVVKNPVLRGDSGKDSAVSYMLFVALNEAGVPGLEYGPYEFNVPGLQVPINGDKAEMSFSLNDVPNPELAAITSIETDGQSSWLQADDGTRVAETIVAPHNADGTFDLAAQDRLLAELCDYTG